MITCKLAGGLGNNLFQFAAVYCMSKKHNIPYCIQSEFERKTFDGKLLKFDNRIKQTCIYEIPKLFENKFNYLNFEQLNSIDFKIYNHHDLSGGFKFKPLPVSTNTIYQGYFQSDKYFENIDLSKEWKINNKILNALKSKYSDLFKKPTISLQYRLGGDRKLGKIPNYYKTVPPLYYRNAVEIILSKCNTKLEDYNVLLFSDEIEEAEQLISETGISAIPIRNNNSILDFVQTTMCDHNVIGNSTFAWWSAFMNSNENKVVVAPKTYWFGKDSGYSHFVLDDLFPSKWELL